MVKVAVAISGGVDSLAALLSLHKAGHQLLAMHALLTAAARVPENLIQICQHLAIPLQIADLRQEFAASVVGPFWEAHRQGLTPNPCASCNQKIKFGFLLEAAQDLGADFLATGHYARLTQTNNGAKILARALDGRKDQSYFLSLVPGQALNKIILPLAEWTKRETLEFVAGEGLKTPIAKESQDICFLKQGDIDKFLADSISPGPIYLQEAAAAPLRAVGKHNGLCHYTIGQRRGLGIAWKEPLYVRKRDFKNNALIVAPRAQAQMLACTVANLNFYQQPEEWPETLFAKLRSNQPPVPVQTKFANDKLEIRLNAPALATAPGQIAAIYDMDGKLLAGGRVTDICFSSANRSSRVSQPA